MQTSLGVFDMGSNTLSFTAARKNASGSLDFFHEGFAVTRLSENLKNQGLLDLKAKERLLEKLKLILKNAQAAGVKNFLLVGTAAFRRARDGQAFAQSLSQDLAIPARILSGAQEAYYSFLAAQKAFDLPRPGVIDVGGGSTEVILGKLDQAQSLAMGTVLFQESLNLQDPIADQAWENLGQSIGAMLQNAYPQKPASPQDWVAVAATPTAIASCLQALPKFEVAKVHGYRMSLKKLKTYLEEIRVMDLATRQQLPGMDPIRAKLVPIGGKILEKIMEFFGVESIRVSHHGLRQGILREELLA